MGRKTAIAIVIVILLVAVFAIVRFVHHSAVPFPVKYEPDKTVAPRVDAEPASAPSKDKEPPASSSVGRATANLLSFLKATAAPTSPSVAVQLEQGRIDERDKYASVSGMVVDESGNAVPDAQVILAVALFRLGEMYEDCALTNENRHYRAATNARGRFEIKDIIYAGAAKISAYANGRTGVKDLEIRPGEAIDHADITVSGAVTLTGRVLQPDGAPVADAAVNAVALLGEGLHYEESTAWNLAYTDSKGIFRMGFPGKGMASLVVAARGFPKTLFQDIPVGDPDLVDLQLLAAASLKGRVTFQDGSPAAGFTVVLKRTWRQYRDDDSRSYSGGEGPFYLAEVDGDGNYAIDGIAPGDGFRVGVRTSSRAFSRDEDLGSFQSGETKTWDHPIASDIKVRGHVYSANTGSPANKCFIHYENMSSGEDKSYDTPGLDAFYEIALVGGSSTYIFSAQYFRSRTTVDLGSDPYAKQLTCEAGGVYTLDLLLPDPVTFPIRVVDGVGNPLAGGAVSAIVDQPEYSNMIGKVGETNADGRFVCDGLPPGLPFHLQIVVSDMPPNESKKHTGQPGEQLPEETVVLTGPIAVTGIAIGIDGNPAANTGITLLPGTAGEVLSRFFYTRTDETGAFALHAPIPEDTSRMELLLDVEAGSNPGASLDNIHIVPGQPLDLGRVQFTPSQ